MPWWWTMLAPALTDRTYSAPIVSTSSIGGISGLPGYDIDESTVTVMISFSTRSPSGLGIDDDGLAHDASLAEGRERRIDLGDRPRRRRGETDRPFRGEPEDGLEVRLRARAYAAERQLLARDRRRVEVGEPRVADEHE